MNGYQRLRLLLASCKRVCWPWNQWKYSMDEAHGYEARIQARASRLYHEHERVRSLCSSSLLLPLPPRSPRSMWWNSFETATRGAARSGPLSPLCGTCAAYLWSLFPPPTNPSFFLSFFLSARFEHWRDDISKSFPPSFFFFFSFLRFSGLFLHEIINL